MDIENIIEKFKNRTPRPMDIKEENIEIIGELDYLVSHRNVTIHCF